MTNRDKIVEIIHQTMDEVNRDFELDGNAKLHGGKEAVLYGKGSTIDSMTLVSFIVAVEENIRRELGLTVTLANEKAMSMERSPFRTLDSMIDYIMGLVGEEQKR